MLAPSDIPVDERLPHLSQVLDEVGMRALFAEHLDRPWKLVRLRVKDARYYPGWTCLLSFHLKCRTEDGETLAVVLHARAFAAGPVPQAFRSRPPLATPVGRLPSYLPQAQLALWKFPDDPGILGMADVWRRKAALFDRPEVLERKPWSGRRPAIETTLVRYVPTKRCILRYDVGEPHGEPFYGKVHGALHAAELHEQAKTLWQWAAQQGPEIVVPRPLGCDRRLNALWQGSPGGEPLLGLVGHVDLEDTLRRVAAALAALHRGPLHPARRQPISEEVRKLERARDALMRFYPDLGREIRAVLDELLDTVPAEPESLRPVHGDFHCNQVLVRDERIAIIDFDYFAMGDPLLDVARFLSRFRAFTQGKILDDEARRAQEGFLSTYEILVPWRVDRARLAWLMSVLMVNHQVLKSVKKLSTGGHTPVSTLLAAASHIALQKDW